METPPLTTNKKTAAKMIKRYQNRKLYDTGRSCYVTLVDLARMIYAQDEIIIIDNKTKRDITASTLAMIIFETEKRAAEYAPINVLRGIIQHGNGSMSGYLEKLGVFKAEDRIAAKGLVETVNPEGHLEVLPESHWTAPLAKPQNERPTSNNNSYVETIPELPGASRAMNT